MLFQWLHLVHNCTHGYIRPEVISSATFGQNSFHGNIYFRVVSVVTCNDFLIVIFNEKSKSEFMVTFRQMQFPWLHFSPKSFPRLNLVRNCFCDYFQSKVFSNIKFTFITFEIVSLVTFSHKSFLKFTLLLAQV